MSIKKRASRWLNLLVTGEPCMLCATAYHKQWAVCTLFDKIFGRHHCKKCFEYERLHNKKYLAYLYGLTQVDYIPPVYRCDMCKKIVDYPVRVSRIMNNEVKNLEFCDDICADKHMVLKIREAGL